MRSEDEVLSGVLSVHVGGDDKRVPELRIRDLREWKKSLGQVVGAVQELSFDKPADLSELATRASDHILDLVITYDKTGALGGREWLEEHATEGEVYVAFRKMLEAAYPFVRDLQGALRQLGQMAAATEASPPASSTNGRSQTGASIPWESKSG